MSENSMPQDAAKTPEREPVTEVGAVVVPGSDAASATAGTAGTASVPARKIKLDGASSTEPMRPAGRLPLLPSDEELAAAVTTPVVAATPAAPTARAKTTARTTAEPANPAPTAPTPAAAGTAPTAAIGKTPVTEPVYVEANPTSMITMRPPAEDVAKRQAAMAKAANTKPVLTRVFQVLIAVFYPIVLLVLAIRLVTSSVFLWVEYHRPGFPADSFGFSTDDRITYGSYTIDYLLNFAPPRYLGDLVDKLGNPLFLAREVGHMADVKSVIVLAFLAGLVLAIVMLIGMIYLAPRTRGGIRRGLFAGSIATLALIIALGVFAVTGWEKFFTEFHKIFFADGTWTFYTDDTLIRLFPSQFWMDAGIFIGAFVLIVSSLTLAFTWPTKDRRRPKAAEVAASASASAAEPASAKRSGRRAA
ncbi:TIGR01906 family membrane protein [Arthrobacter sp. PAMC 25486]|uniref:TIGR01906 family membrane protein n=1 Tax=Arthrobacter sp. PAMC 25486 TaxID=1494608 RepID=UPI0020A68385|nr:TIGR01906 family membrane protein [Arthrobacter sp. PAMC 25486]